MKLIAIAPGKPLASVQFSEDGGALHIVRLRPDPRVKIVLSEAEVESLRRALRLLDEEKAPPPSMASRPARGPR